MTSSQSDSFATVFHQISRQTGAFNLLEKGLLSHDYKSQRSSHDTIWRKRKHISLYIHPCFLRLCFCLFNFRVLFFSFKKQLFFFYHPSFHTCKILLLSTIPEIFISLFCLYIFHNHFSLTQPLFSKCHTLFISPFQTSFHTFPLSFLIFLFPIG